MSYSVEVEGAAGANMRTNGRIELEPTAGGTRVVWREHGDLGSNPLMGYWARSMRRVQSTEMEKGLDRLAEAAAAGRTPEAGHASEGDDRPPVSSGNPAREAPADTGSTGAG